METKNGRPGSLLTLNANVGDVVQIGASDNVRDPFQGKLGFIDEIKVWGVVVRIEVFEGDAYYRAPYGEFAVIGPAYWYRMDSEEVVRWEQTIGADYELTDAGAGAGISPSVAEGDSGI